MHQVMLNRIACLNVAPAVIAYGIAHTDHDVAKNADMHSASFIIHNSKNIP